MTATRSTMLLATTVIVANFAGWASCRDAHRRAPVVVGDAPQAPDRILPVDERPGFARVQIEGIVIEFITWSSRDAGATCSTLKTFSVKGDDPWGTQLALLCSQSAGQLQIVVTSAGPDRVFGTEDDLDARSFGRR